MMPCNLWVREEIRGLKTYDAPQMSSSIKVRDITTGSGKSVNNHIGYFVSNANNVYFNGTNVLLLSECFCDGHGLSVIPENFHKVTTLFAARRSIQRTWINWQDEYVYEEY